MKYEECLSILELLDLSGRGSSDSRALSHVETCVRCSVLYERLESTNREIPAIPPNPGPSLARPSRPSRGAPISPGQLWRMTEGADSEVIVVLGTSRQLKDATVVALTSTEIEQATDLDLVIRTGPLGYPFMVCAWNFGTTLRTQLRQFLGDLSPQSIEDVRGLHKHVVMDVAPPTAMVGPSIVSDKDPRLSWRSRELERTRRYWRQAHERVAAIADVSDLESEPTPTFASLLNQVLAGDEWDAASLLEAAKIEHKHLESLRVDSLDLTEQTDIPALAKVIRVLGWDYDTVEAAVEASLLRSPGGQFVGRGGFEKLAARSSSPVHHRPNRDIYRELEDLDTSQAARRRAVADYLGQLEDFLDRPERH